MARSFPQDFIDRVRENSNIVSVIGEYVSLKRGGSNWMGLCPFHHEKSPSFSVSEDKQLYHCFGCKKSGNVYTFVQDHLGLTFPEAVEQLANRSGMAIPDEPVHQRERSDAKKLMAEVNGRAKDFYHRVFKKLAANHPAKVYLKSRGFSDKEIDDFQLGYAPAEWDTLSIEIEKNPDLVNAAEVTGVIKKRNNGSGHFDFFRDRILFPIFAPTKQVLGFGGRVLSSEQQPKYLNSLDSPLFHKGRVLYGLSHSAKYLREQDFAIVVEGYMDWHALNRAGFHNVVATLGTALTVEHAHLIRRYTDNVVVLFDGDEAGQMAMQRSLPILLQEGVFARGLTLVDELDPDEYIEAKGREALATLIQNAPDLFILNLEGLLKKSRLDAAGKVKLLDQVQPLLLATHDPRLRRLYVEEVAVRIQMDVAVIERSLRDGKPAVGAANTGSAAMSATADSAGARTTPMVGTPRKKIVLNKISRLELEFLNVLLLSDVFMKEVEAINPGEWLEHPGARELFDLMILEYRQNPSGFANLGASFIEQVEPRESLTLMMREPMKSLGNEGAQKLFKDCVKRLRENYLKSESKRLALEIRGSLDSDKLKKLEQIMNIQRQRKGLNEDNEI